MRLTVSCLLLCGSLYSQTTMTDVSDSKRGGISGIVLDERAQAVPGILVKATPLDCYLFGTLPQTYTDATGHFSMTGLYPGRTYVNAFDEAAFYPDAASNLWDGQGVRAEIDILPGHEVSGILLALKPVGRIEVNAVSAETGASINDITVKIERVGEPNRWIEGNKASNWWLVPVAPVRLRIGAKGFLPSWYGPLTISARDVFVAKVFLHPQPTAAPGTISSEKR